MIDKALQNIGLIKGTVKLEPWTEQWEKTFESEQKYLTELFGKSGLSVTVVHIGSTAVKEMPAKPIVDFLLGFPSNADLIKARKVMLDDGYEYFPIASQPGMFFMAKTDGDIRFCHYQITRHGGKQWREVIAFRNLLRRSERARNIYIQTKQTALEKSKGNRLLYQQAKRSRIESLMLFAMKKQDKTRSLRRSRRFIVANNVVARKRVFGSPASSVGSVINPSKLRAPSKNLFEERVNSSKKQQNDGPNEK